MTSDANQHDADEEPRGSATTRRRLFRRAGGAALVLAVSASGALALRRVGAKDDDDDSDSGGGHSGSGGSDDGENSGHGGGDDVGDNSGHGGGDDDDGDDDGENEDTEDEDVVATDPVPAGAVEVRIISDDAGGFSPGELTVDVGATVAFVNGHDDAHTATGADFDTGIIQPGRVATVVLDEPGEYFYACQIHPEMTGSIVVRGDVGATPAASPAASPEASPASDGASAAASVAIRDFAFDPPALTVAAGTTVTWENADSAPHTASADDGSFGTGQIDPGATGSATFDQSGTFPYRCAFHPDMTGTVTVE